MLSWWFGTNWFQMKKISANSRRAPRVLFFASRRIYRSPRTLHLRAACLPRAKTAAFFRGDASRRASWRFEIGLHLNASAGRRPLLRLLLLLPVHLCLALSPSCYEGHQASGGAGPQEESKRAFPPPALPSLLPLFHNLLFMSDRPPPDKWLPYGERKAGEKEGRKEKTLSLHPLSPRGLPEFFSSRFFFF